MCLKILLNKYRNISYTAFLKKKKAQKKNKYLFGFGILIWQKLI